MSWDGLWLRGLSRCGIALPMTIVRTPSALRLAHPSEYRSWVAMRSRCRFGGHPDYGGRGIVVCERWRLSFAAFIADLGPKPSPDHTIERRDVDGDYEPGNCVWLPRSLQARNKRSTVRLRDGYHDRPVVEIAEDLGLDPSRLRGAANAGHSLVSALELAAKVKPVADEVPLIDLISPRHAPKPVALIKARGRCRQGWIVGGSYLLGYSGVEFETMYWSYVPCPTP